MNCPNCATSLPANAKFCFNCGHQMGTPAPVAPAAPAQAPPVEKSNF